MSKLLSNYIKEAEPEVGNPDNFVRNITRGTGVLKSGIVASQIIKAGKNEYQRIVLSRCANRSGADARKCKMDALRFQENYLRGKLSTCTKSKDPTKCREKIEKNIEKVRNDEEKISLSLRKQ